MENEIVLYNKARKVIEDRFHGLTHTHTTLIKSLITLADPDTGIVSGVTYHDLCKLLTVDPSPGRKGVGMPQKQTIRSYLRTIEDNAPDDFKLITQGQKLKIQFLNLPKIYAHFFAQKKEYTEGEGGLSSVNPMENKENNLEFELNYSTDNTADSPVEKESAKKLFILNNKHNKQTGAVASENLKRFISPDFYPSNETIAIALEQGFTQAQNPEEIQKFIKYNLDNNCLWADFNPVFLSWLRRGFEYRQQRQPKTQAQNIRRSGGHERTTKKNNTYEQLMEQVMRDNADACAPSESYARRKQPVELFDEQPHWMAVGSTYADIWPAISKQARQ